MRRYDERQTLARAILVVALFGSGPGFGVTGATAQTPSMNLMPEMKSQTPEEKERDAAADKAYRESLRKIPDQAATDPWGNVRSADQARAAKSASSKTAPAAKQVKRQTKTEGATN